MLERELHHLVVVEFFCFFVDGVTDDIVVFAAAVDGAAMREMAAHNQIHTHDRITDIEQAGVDGIVGGRAGKRLHIHVEVVGAQTVAGEYLRRPPARQGLDDIGVFRALVVALVRVAAKLRQATFIIQDLALC